MQLGTKVEIKPQENEGAEDYGRQEPETVEELLSIPHHSKRPTRMQDTIAASSQISCSALCPSRRASRMQS